MRFVAPVSLLILATCALGACDNTSTAGAPLERGTNESGPLPRLTKVPDFSLTSQSGQPFGSKELRGKPYVAAFMFTRCPSICPKLMGRMKEVDKAVKKAGKELQLVSISVDPDNDTPDVLTKYAAKHSANVSNWTLLTGDYKIIAKTSEEGFKVGLSGTIDETKEHLGITHGSHLVLVDEEGTIRGYYRSSEESTPSDLVRALEQL